ncbi:heme/hemin ABC transporter substrate-binding protein [Aeromicrobium duanguangcaii]|uniref:ABC transporter substrate-binding protein n=1 Tax=Aeromicrobium duanguangcaii TaxID=2968086 RepID=A0ABY5KCH5_9ACTN|nr:ABC transporter substrate-binding protein [Aeromicrobium duanguangcaii]MCD9155321.1 ABC transporter substrate-binding protein [Aeromicrobium duanguangcaii]UUI68030.1 ABC transporter substrate-binding protein [Aeromicrobium duanguangcaii]
MKRLVATLASVVLTASLAACGGAADGSDPGEGVNLPPLSELEAKQAPQDITGPSTAMLSEREVEPIDVGEQPTLPATVTSHVRSGDVKVKITDTSRIVAFDMSGSIASTLFGLGLGDQLVARDRSTDFPGAENLPLITSEGHAVNAEAVLAQKPTVIITDGSMGPRDVVEQLADTGVPVVFVERESTFDGAVRLARDVAEVVGLPKTGAALAERLQTDIDDARAQVERFVPEKKSERLRMVFLYLRGNSGVYYLFADDSGVGDLVKSLGGVDVAKELGWKAMQPLTDEAIIKAKPDLILLMTHGLESSGGIDGLLEEKPAIALTPAGQTKRFVDMADGDILAFGPRTAGVVEALGRAIYVPEAQK